MSKNRGESMPQAPTTSAEVGYYRNKLKKHQREEQKITLTASFAKTLAAYDFAPNRYYSADTLMRVFGCNIYNVPRACLLNNPHSQWQEVMGGKYFLLKSITEALSRKAAASGNLQPIEKSPNYADLRPDACELLCDLKALHKLKFFQPSIEQLRQQTKNKWPRKLLFFC